MAETKKILAMMSEWGYWGIELVGPLYSLSPSMGLLPDTQAFAIVVLGGLERFVSAGDGPGAAALVRARADDLFR